jgi:hypothetical protein
MPIDVRSGSAIGLLAIIAFCLAALTYGLFFRFLATQSEIGTQVKVQLENVAERCEIKEETANVLKRTTEVLGELPRCSDLVNAMGDIRNSNTKTTQFIERVDTFQKDEVERWNTLNPAHLSSAVLGEQGIQKSVSQLADASAPFQQTVSAIDARTRSLTQCDSADLGALAPVCVDNRLSGSAMFNSISVSQAGVHKELQLRKTTDATTATLGSMVLSTHALLDGQQEYFESKLTSAVEGATSAIRDPDRAVIEWLSTHSWRPQPRFKRVPSGDNSSRESLTVIVPAAAQGDVGSVCRNILVLAYIPTKSDADDLHALNGLCGDHVGADSSFSCIANGTRNEEQAVSLNVHAIVATVGPLVPVESKAECRGEIRLHGSVIDLLNLPKQKVDVLLGVDPDGVRKYSSSASRPTARDAVSTAVPSDKAQ